MAMTREEARMLNQQGIATGGCVDCVSAAQRWDSQGRNLKILADAKTQWRMDELHFIRYMAFCPEHFKREISKVTDF